MGEALTQKRRDAAKYDAACASSGATGRKAARDGIGSTTGVGICHSYAPDGRRISLLKLLLTSYRLFDCTCCINRRAPGQVARREGFEAFAADLKAAKKTGATPEGGVMQAAG